MERKEGTIKLFDYSEFLRVNGVMCILILLWENWESKYFKNLKLHRILLVATMADLNLVEYFHLNESCLCQVYTRNYSLEVS